MCGRVRVGLVQHSCDEVTTNLAVTLLSQDTLPGKRAVSLRFSNTTVEAQVCPDTECPLPTPGPATTTSPVGAQSSLVVSVVVAVILTVFMLLLVLLLTFLIKRAHHW